MPYDIFWWRDPRHLKLLTGTAGCLRAIRTFFFSDGVILVSCHPRHLVALGNTTLLSFLGGVILAT
jgi:hypothetical protein